jgi:hypothetical protein
MLDSTDQKGELWCQAADQNGRYTIQLDGEGHYIVSPRSVRDGSENGIIFATDEYPPSRGARVTLNEANRSGYVDLRMPQRNGVLLVTAVDSSNHLPIELAIIRVCPAERMLNCAGSAFRSDTGEYKIYTPPYPFNISIGSPDYHEWIQSGDRESVILPGASRALYIAMKPLGETRNDSEEQLGPLLAAPVQLAPAEGSKFDAMPRITTLRWGEVESAVSYAVEVDYCQDSQNLKKCLQPAPLIFPAGSWGNPLFPGTTEETTLTFNFIGSQSGRWRVWAVDKYGRKGFKSPWRMFFYAR